MTVQTAQDATFFEGEYKELEFAITDDDAVAVSLSGATVAWKMLRGDATGTVMLSKTNSSGITVDAGTGGTGRIVIATGDTTDMGGESYYHEMIVTKSSKPEVVFIGTIELLKSALL